MAKNYRLIDAMREKGWSCYRLAAEAGIDRKIVSYARIGCTPRVKNAIAIARALGTSVEELFGDC